MKAHSILSHMLTGVVGFGVGLIVLVPSIEKTRLETPSVSPSPLATPVYSMDRTGLLKGINEERLRKGAPMVSYDSSMQAFADLRVKQVAEQYAKDGTCSHDGFLDSSESKDTKRNIGENLACNYPTDSSALSAWEASPTHETAMVDKQYSLVTISTDGRFAVALFSTQAYAE